MTERPSLPGSAPACWSWELPILPVRNNAQELATWQGGRCAVCAQVGQALFKDHDHRTGNVRGFLCGRCNTMEGARKPRPVFVSYRARHPATMLGVQEQYRAPAVCPMQAAADNAWMQALADLRMLTDQAAWDARLARHEEDCQSWINKGLPEAAVERLMGPAPQRPEWTPLTRAAHCVGWTGAEWDRIQEGRQLAAHRQSVAVRRAECRHCRGTPPMGFTCNLCGTRNDPNGWRSNVLAGIGL